MNQTSTKFTIAMLPEKETINSALSTYLMYNNVNVYLPLLVDDWNIVAL